MSTPSPQDTFPFLSLPPELRQRIYGFCAPQNERFDIFSSTSVEEHRVVKDREQRVGPNSFPQLLRTCRQIHDESKRLLYRNNVFVATRILAVGSWPKMDFFGPESQKEIRHMSFRLSWPTFDLTEQTVDESWENMLGSLSTLELIVANYFHKGVAGKPDFFDHHWTKQLRNNLETIKRLVPQETKIMVDVGGDKRIIKIFEQVIPNRCIFGRLEAGDELFSRKWMPDPERRKFLERRALENDGLHEERFA